MVRKIVWALPLLATLGCTHRISPSTKNLPSVDEPKTVAAATKVENKENADAAELAKKRIAAVAAPIIKTATTGTLAVTHANGPCKSNECWIQSNNTGGCAACVTLVVYLPLGSQVTAIRCYTNAGGPGGDTPSIYQARCGDLDAWATFDRPVQFSTPNNVVVTTTFHNRSHNRQRMAELQVDWL